VPARDLTGTVREYHDQTKHHFKRFARSLGYLDWATQPDPFRTFDGAARIDLIEPLRAAAGGRGSSDGRTWTEVSYDELFVPAASPRVAPGLPAVSVFLRYSLGLSAWKQAGPSRWALRVNPSSGNLHPTEGYAVCGPGVAGEHPGVFHYAPDAHGLEQRCVFAPAAWDAAVAHLPPGTFLAALTSIHWREAWKYGERAFRYCQHDIGHAVAAMRMAAALIGWEFSLVPGWSSESLAALLGVDRSDDFAGAEQEEPACLVLVSPATSPGESGGSLQWANVDPRLAEGVRAGAWTGRANRLSADRVQWDVIDAAAEASRQTLSATRAVSAGHSQARGYGTRSAASPPASAVLLGRRSAVALDGRSSIDLDRFAFMMRRLLPEACPPFDALCWEPRLHLVLFVHRVTGLEPGIYVLARTDDAVATLQRALHADFAWIRPAGVPDDLPLFLLAPLDARQIARQLSCAQDIAADGFFSLGMLAEFDDALAAGGPPAYRRLFWEAGAIGQALYLEAEAAGARGTGIGCFFDDGVHELLGITDHRLQSLYHFTVGIPVNDSRLTTHPGYAWEDR
jgi:SagB-type dehydrogenase family enzyme